MELAWRDASWIIRKFQAPAPLVDTQLAAFMSAWKASRVDDIANLFRASSVDRMKRSLTKSFEARAWVDPSGRLKLPALGSPELGKNTGTRQDFHFDSAAGPCRFTFGIGEQGTWELRSLELP